MLLQQGDVLLERIEKNEIKGEKLNHLILAEGEATGHSHKIISGVAELYISKEEEIWLKVLEESVLGHEEHGKITIPIGDYRVRKVREYDHFQEEAREVRD